MRSDTRTIRSMGLNTRITPGPLARDSTRPRRKITPRSYSARILMDESRYNTTMSTTTAVVESIFFAFLEFRDFLDFLEFLPLDRLDGEPQSFNRLHPHTRSGRDRFGRDRVPIFAPHEDLAFRRDLAGDNAHLPNHTF